jgi:dipeptidyl aminopeptidase/acylaminoacyl peptidase
MVSLLVLCAGLAQAPPPPAAPSAPRPAAERDHRWDQLSKAVDDLKWRLDLADLAQVNQIRYTSLPPANVRNPKAPGATNPLIVHAYVFTPKRLDRSKKHPLLTFVHGGIHGDVSAQTDIHIVRELLEQGYVVLAPDYRGSTGYGGGYYNQIDYGGREVEDVYQAYRWAVENLDYVDPKRAGILGWSHGGMITLHNIFEHPDDFVVAYAGVPVSDVIFRLGYSTEQYRALFSSPDHIGKPVREDIAEYHRRSPIAHVAKLRTPLLIHTNTNDEDVNYLEVERLIQALKAEGKKFEYKVYENAPGGHAFNRLDTKLAQESRAEIYRFLARYLKPERPAR